MVHCVDCKLNLTPLPVDHREDSLASAYEHLEPGQTLQAIDDFNPQWVREYLSRRFDVELTEEHFWIEERAGRFVAFVCKPEEETGAAPGARTAAGGAGG